MSIYHLPRSIARAYGTSAPPPRPLSARIKSRTLTILEGTGLLVFFLGYLAWAAAMTIPTLAILTLTHLHEMVFVKRLVLRPAAIVLAILLLVWAVHELLSRYNNAEPSITSVPTDVASHAAQLGAESSEGAFEGSASHSVAEAASSVSRSVDVNITTRSL